MRPRNQNKVIILWTCLLIVHSLFVFTVESKGSSSGGGGGGRGTGGGRGGRSSGGSKISGKKVALGAAAVGVAGYAAYKHTQERYSPHRTHSNPIDNPAFHSGGGAEVELDEDYKLIEASSYYNRGEGFGMSAFGLIALILAIVGFCTLIWYCSEIILPLWKDRQSRSHDPESLYNKEDHPLHETPSTATPSP